MSNYPLQPCQILGALSSNQLIVQTSQQKLVILTVNQLPEQQLNVFNTNKYLDFNEELPLYYFELYQQLNSKRNVQASFQYLNRQSAKANIFLNGEDLGLKLNKALQDKDLNGNVSILDLSCQAKRTFILQNKKVEGLLINFYDGILVFYVPSIQHVIELVPQELSHLDLNSEKAKQFILKHWLGTSFKINLKGVIQVVQEYKPKKILKGEVTEGKLNNKFYEDLVAHGFAKLSDYAKIVLSDNEVQLLLQYQEVAINQQIGIWQFGKLDRKKLNEKSNQTIGTIVEVIEPTLFVIEKKEGDIINIQLDRIFVEGNEAKDFVVKLAIGKKVQIIQINRSYQLQLLDPDIDMEEELVKQGWGTPKQNHPYISQFRLNKLLELNKKAKNQKIGMYDQFQSNRIINYSDIKYIKFVHENVWNVIQQKYSHQKKIEQVGMIQNQKYLTIQIEQILNINLFIIRIEESNVLVRFSLQGIEVPEINNNFPEIEEIKKNILKKIHYQLIQRTFYTLFTNFLFNQNCLQGFLYQDLNDLSNDLVSHYLKNGYAYISAQADYDDHYQKIQEKAQNENIGIWKETFIHFQINNKMKSSGKRNEGTIKKTQENIPLYNIVVSEIIDINQFYIQQSESFEILEIQNNLANIKKEQLKPLIKPVKLGTLCISLFEGEYYRAKVIKIFKNDNYLVYYIDYGNQDKVAFQDMGQIPLEIQKYEEQAKLCGLAYMKVPQFDHEFGYDASEIFKDLVWANKKLDATIQYFKQEKGKEKLYLMLYPQDSIECQEVSLNVQLLIQGCGRIDEEVENNQLLKFRDAQEKAHQDEIGIWAYDDTLDHQEIEEHEYDY